MPSRSHEIQATFNDQPRVNLLETPRCQALVEAAARSASVSGASRTSRLFSTFVAPAVLGRDMALESGEVDLAAGYFENFDGSFRQQMLFEEHYVGMVRRGHPTILDSLSLETFLATPQLVYQPTGGGHGLQESAVDQAFAVADVPRRVAVRGAHSMGVASIVSSTDLLVIVPSRLAAACRELAEVNILPVPIEIPSFQVKQHWHERFHHDPGNRWVRGLIAELFQVRPNRDADSRIAVADAS